MSVLSFIGMIISIIGVFLIGYGGKKTQTLTNKVLDGITGHYTQSTRWYLIGGVIALIFGALLIYLGWQPTIVTQP